LGEMKQLPGEREHLGKEWSTKGHQKERKTNRKDGRLEGGRERTFSGAV